VPEVIGEALATGIRGSEPVSATASPA